MGLIECDLMMLKSLLILCENRLFLAGFLADSAEVSVERNQVVRCVLVVVIVRFALLLILIFIGEGMVVVME